MEPLRKVCVFCGSKSGANPVYREAATELGRLLVARGLDLVYGGGSIGLMGVIADAVLAHGGRAYGVIPGLLATRELAHPGLTELEIVPSMHVRKARMAELADAFIALPGALGTLDELCEIVTWSQLGLHCKPVGILNTAGYFNPLVQLIDQAIAEEFLRPVYRDLFFVADEPHALLEQLPLHRPPSGLLGGLPGLKLDQT